jgi:glycosyltransferase involved in cell wall biosynthesis
MDDCVAPKILQLTTHLNIGGISTYILESSVELKKNGYDISVLSSGGELESTFTSRGIKVFSFPFRTKSILSPRLWAQFPKILKFIKEEKFDCLHAHTRVTQVLAYFLSHFSGVAYISTSHGFFRRRLGRKLLPAWGQRVIAISPLVAEELETLHRVPRQKVRVIFNGLNIKERRKRVLEQNPPQIRRKLGIPEKSFVIGSVSRLVRDKGHEYLVEAAGKLKKEFPGIFLLIVGEGRERAVLEKLAKKNGLSQQSLFISSAPEIVEFLSVMDVFVHPAVYREGFGLVILEAMIAKVPVIATDIWSINTIIRDHLNGFLVEPKSAPAIAKAIQSVMKAPEAAGEIAHHAYEMAAQNYSVERMAGEMAMVYNEVIRTKSSS